MTEFYNLFGDAEVPVLSPDSDQDWFLLGDKIDEHQYWQDKVADLFKSLSLSGNDCFIMYGGEITDGGSGTIDISAGAAITKDSSGNTRFVRIPAQTGVALPSGWNDNRQIWIPLIYDYKYGASTRTHYAGTVYHPHLADTFLGDSSGLVGGSSDDLFVDADPNATPDTIACLGSFQMSAGNVFTSLDTGEKTEVLRADNSVVYSKYVTTQHEFNELFTRTGAGTYDIKDEITSIFFDSVNTYTISGMLQSGDTSVIISTNNCKKITGDGEVIWDIDGYEGYLLIHTDNCIVENIHIKGDNTTALSSGYSTFSIDASAVNVVLNNCTCTDRAGVVGAFRDFATTKTAKFYNCRADNNGANQYINCANLVNCISNNAGTNGFDGCSYLSNCISNSNAGSGFNACINITSCKATNNTLYGFSACTELSACKVVGSARGFSTCNRLSACYSTAQASYGFYSCNELTGCRADGVTAGNGFYVCANLSGCLSSGNSSNGFLSCNQLSACRATGNLASGFRECTALSGCLGDTNTDYGYRLCTFISGGCRAVSNGSYPFLTAYGVVPNTVVSCNGSDSLGNPLFLLELSGAYTTVSSQGIITHGVANMVTSNRLVSLDYKGRTALAADYLYTYYADTIIPIRAVMKDSTVQLFRATSSSSTYRIELAIMFK